MKVEYYRAQNEPKKVLTEDETELERLEKLKSRDKLTKKKRQEMIDLTKKIHKKREKEHKDETEKRLRKEVAKEMKESSAVVSESSQNNLKRQIILKVFYIILKVIRNFVSEPAFESILDVLLIFAPKADPQFISEVLQELQGAYRSLETMPVDDIETMRRRILLIAAITKISSEQREIIRIECRC